MKPILMMALTLVFGAGVIAAPESKPVNLDEALAHAKGLLTSGRHQEALDEYIKIVEIDGENP